MASDDKPPLPGAVLFACNLNRVRSPMAEALLKKHLGDRVFVDSCGTVAANGALEDDDEVDPFAKAVMQELGCDLSRHNAKTFDDLQDASFDVVISLTPEAHKRAVELARGRAVEVEYWPTSDPTQSEGAREARLGAYREVRDALAARIVARFGR
jgi:protein-tyrosine-phosphatase